MTKEVFVLDGKFYLTNPFEKDNERSKTKRHESSITNRDSLTGRSSLVCNGWHFSQVNHFTLVEEVGSDVYYKFPSKDGVVFVCDKQVKNKVVYYRKKNLYLFLKENKITTIQKNNPNTVYYSTSNDFKLITDGFIEESIVDFSKVIGIHSEQNYKIKYCVSKASFVVLATKRRTVLYTENSLDKIQDLVKKYIESQRE